MKIEFTPSKNPRVIVVQKLYSKIYNNDQNLTFPNHRFKKFIKDVVNGTLERSDLINDEIKNHLQDDINLKNIDKVIEIILISAIFEFLYKPNISS